MNMIIVGIDLGTRNCGVAEIFSSGGKLAPEMVREETIIVPKKLNDIDSITYIMDEILKVYFCSSAVNLVGIERFDYQGHDITREAHVSYLLMGNLNELRHHAPIVWLRPIQWKQDISGQRGCSDYQLQSIINLRLGLPQKHRWSSEHAVDAAGIAIVACDRHQLAQAAGVKESELRSNARRGKR